MRTLLVVLIILMGFSVALAQTPSPSTSIVTVTTFTGTDGTSGSLTFTLSGTFPGDPLAFTLDQPDDLQPGLTNAYSFSVPYDFCQLFQFSLRLVGDDWLGERLTVNVNGIDVWFNGRYADSGAMTATVTRGGTWDGTDAYRAACPTLPVELSFITGEDGTADTPWFTLQGDFSASPYSFILNQPVDLQPGQTDTYLYRVPMGFCQMTGWQLTKAASGAVDDPWLPSRIDLSIDSVLVFFDAVFNEVGPITAEEGASGTWDGTEAYQSRCAPGVAITPPLAPTLVEPPINVLPAITGTPVNSVNQLQTIVPLLPGGQPVAPPQVTPELGVPPLAITPVVGIAQCPGAPASRLEIGGVGRVTPGAPNRVRAQASTSSAILGNMPAGTAFIVLAGPVCANGYAWWQVNFNGIIGWTAEGSGAVYFLEPA